MSLFSEHKSRRRARSRGSERAPDRGSRTPVIGVVFLLAFTPLAFGAVHPWAFSLVEGIIFFLVLLWAVRLFRTSRDGPGIPFRISPFLVPSSLFILFVLFQLVPLPPTLIQVLSPSTYEIYTRSLPGWPDSPPYERLLAAYPSRNTQLEESGGGDEGARGGSTVAGDGSPEFAEPEVGGRPSAVGGQQSAVGGQQSAVGGRQSEWLPLSLAPALTGTDLLKFTAYTALFFLILCCPLPASMAESERGGEWEKGGPHTSLRRTRREDTKDQTPRPQDLTAEQLFARKILFTVLICGFVVAVLGFLNLFTWNGRILWLFQPYDEGAGAGELRASAPFISPDTFANYLAVIFPLFVVATFFTSFLSIRRFGGAFRILYGFATFILICALLLSLSRGGWGAAVVGAGVVLFLLAGHAKKRKTAFGREHGPTLRRLTVAAVSAAFVGVLLYVGPQGRENVDLRLTETLEQRVDFFGRATIWRDAIGIVRDFPILGVGLGAWPELFPRYQNPRLGHGFYREAHNDYLEVLSETGIAGFLLLVWFFWACFRRILRGLRNCQRVGESESGRGGDRYTVPVVCALIAGMSAMAFHELFDFNLQIPANAVLFTVFLAIALRLTVGFQREEEGARERGEKPRPTGQRLVAVVMGLGSLVLMREAFTQKMLPYPHNLTLNAPKTIAQAVERIRDYPAQSDAHLYLFQLMSALPAPLATPSVQVPLPDSREENGGGREEEGTQEVSAANGEGPAEESMADDLQPAEIARTGTEDASRDAHLVVPRNPTRAKSQAGERRRAGTRASTFSTRRQNVQAAPASGPRPGLLDTPIPMEDLLSELEKALWLEPKNTRARDVYAALLIREGRFLEGLAEVTRSVRDAPSMSSHFYLARDFVPLLSLSEQEAIERGFKEAMAGHNERVMDQLGHFYAATNRFGQKAALFEDAAAVAADPELKRNYLLQAAYTSAQSEDFKGAEDFFYKVLQLAPGDTRIYHDLIKRVFKPQRDMQGVREVVVEGISRGADAFTLYLALAEASRAADELDTARAAVREASELLRNGRRNGSSRYSEYITLIEEARRSRDLELAKSLLEEVAELAPATYRELYRLGTLYAQVGRYDRAGYYFRRATQVNPRSATAFYQLGRIEERNYRFHVADSAYANAVRLDPNNQGMREQYERFKKRVRVNRPQATGHRQQAN